MQKTMAESNVKKKNTKLKISKFKMPEGAPPYEPRENPDYNIQDISDSNSFHFSVIYSGLSHTDSHYVNTYNLNHYSVF